MIDTKIKNLHSKIQQDLLSDFNFKMGEVLSFCESPIEQIFILHLYNYFLNDNRDVDWIKTFTVDFIEDTIFLQDYDDETDKLNLKNQIKKYNYRETNSCYLKYVGFKVSNTFSNRNFNGKLTFQEFEIRPQYTSYIEGTKYRIDIAILLNIKDDDKIIEKRKIAIECDGYDYHSTPSQKKNDDIRSRKLKSNGWREVFRYSGSELFDLNDEKIHLVIKEINKMLYI
jgi:very-short-patch-repair endonuclease